MDFVKKFLIKRENKSEVRALGGVRAFLLPALDFFAKLLMLASSSCFLVRFVSGLTQKFY